VKEKEAEIVESNGGEYNHLIPRFIVAASAILSITRIAGGVKTTTIFGASFFYSVRVWYGRNNLLITLNKAFLHSFW
jgi:hypothetical protein